MRIKYTRQALRWLFRNNINTERLDRSIFKLCSKEGRTKIKYLRIHIMPRAIDSNYDYYTNTLNVAVQSKSSDQRNKKLRRVLRNLLHELRHFIQFRIYEKPFKLTYSYRDMTLMNSRYWNDPDEVDARRYEKRKLNWLYKIIIKR